MVAKTLIILRLEFYFALNSYISIPYSLIWLVCHTQKTYFFICFLYSYYFRQKVRGENPFRIFHPNYWLRTNFVSQFWNVPNWDIWVYSHTPIPYSTINESFLQLVYSLIYKLSIKYKIIYTPLCLAEWNKNCFSVHLWKLKFKYIKTNPYKQLVELLVRICFDAQFWNVPVWNIRRQSRNLIMWSCISVTTIWMWWRFTVYTIVRVYERKLSVTVCTNRRAPSVRTIEFYQLTTLRATYGRPTTTVTCNSMFSSAAAAMRCSRRGGGIIASFSFTCIAKSHCWSATC